MYNKDNKTKGVDLVDTILRLNGITKKYKKATVVDSFSLTAKRGHICGLIGPNGAGKTTIMKIMAGLTLQTSGELEFFGNKDNLDEERKRMSFMIESPVIDPLMTARENMEYVRTVRGIADKNKTDEILKLVGLADTGKKIAKNFSLGMKQRLGIGMSLITSPEFMVLDEPVNGLDPEGIVEVRNLLKKLAEEQNVTILISSHLLSELSELCTDFTIINHGKLIESFSAEELMIKCKSRISIKTDDINKTAAILEDKLGISEYKVIHNDEIHLYEMLDKPETVSRTIFENGLNITKFVTEGESLEEYYLSKVGDVNE